MFNYQYTRQQTEITDGILEWLYEHSAGVTSVVVALIHDAQEIAILNGKEALNLESLNAAYEQRLSLLHGYIQPSILQAKQTSKTKKRTSIVDLKIADNEVNDDRISIADLVAKAKEENMDIVQLLKAHMPVVEVAI